MPLIEHVRRIYILPYTYLRYGNFVEMYRRIVSDHQNINMSSSQANTPTMSQILMPHWRFLLSLGAVAGWETFQHMEPITPV